MSKDQAPAAASAVDGVLDQALARLGRSVGFDAARALAYDPDVLPPPLSCTGNGWHADQRFNVRLGNTLGGGQTVLTGPSFIDSSNVSQVAKHTAVGNRQ